MKNVKVLSLMAGCFLAACPVTAGAQHVSPEPPIMGWSSWNTYRVNINEALIRTQPMPWSVRDCRRLGIVL